MGAGESGDWELVRGNWGAARRAVRLKVELELFQWPVTTSMSLKFTTPSALRSPWAQSSVEMPLDWPARFQLPVTVSMSLKLTRPSRLASPNSAGEISREFSSTL